MAIRVFLYCLSKPYPWGKANNEDRRAMVKKTALSYVLDNCADIAEVMSSVDDVCSMMENGGIA